MNRLEALMEMLESEETPDAFTRYAIAQEYANQKDFSKAFHWFEATLQTDALYVPAYQQWGLALAESGDLDKAEEVLRKGLNIAREKGDFHTAEEIEAAIEDL